MDQIIASLVASSPAPTHLHPRLLPTAKHLHLSPCLKLLLLGRSDQACDAEVHPKGIKPEKVVAFGLLRLRKQVRATPQQAESL